MNEGISISISPHISQSLATETHEINEMMVVVPSLGLQSDEDMHVAGELLKVIKEKWKELEERRTAMTAPIYEGLRQIQGFFKPLQEPLKRAELILKSKMSDFALAQKAANEAAMQAAAAALQQGAQIEASQELARIIPPAAVQGISLREVWDFTIENADLVPKEYCSPDVAKIKKAIWYANTERTPPLPIPGIRFFLKNQVSVRT